MVDYLSLDAEGGPGLQTALPAIGHQRADLSCLGKRPEAEGRGGPVP